MVEARSEKRKTIGRHFLWVRYEGISKAVLVERKPFQRSLRKLKLGARAHRKGIGRASVGHMADPGQTQFGPHIPYDLLSQELDI